MSRSAAGDTILVPPKSNVYTVLVAVALLAAVLAEVVVYMKAKELFPVGGLMNSDETPPPVVLH